MTDRTPATLAGFIEVTSVHDGDLTTNKIYLKPEDIGFVRAIRTPTGYSTVLGAMTIDSSSDIWEVVETPIEIFQKIRMVRYEMSR